MESFLKCPEPQSPDKLREFHRGDAQTELCPEACGSVASGHHLCLRSWELVSSRGQKPMFLDLEIPYLPPFVYISHSVL